MKIANIVSTVTLSSPLDLTLLHNRLPRTEIPGKSPWLKLRLPPDNTYIAFYKSGKFLITIKDPEKIPLIAKQVLDLLIAIGLDVKIVDIKLPDSGEGESFLWDNLNYLTSQDELKFVLKSRNDFDCMLQIIREHQLEERSSILVSLVSDGDLSPDEVAELILQNRLKVRFQVQLHKLIWGNQKGR